MCPLAVKSKGPRVDNVRSQAGQRRLASRQTDRMTCTSFAWLP